MADFRTHPSRSPCLYPGAIGEGVRGERDRALVCTVIVCSLSLFSLILVRRVVITTTFLIVFPRIVDKIPSVLPSGEFVVVNWV